MVDIDATDWRIDPSTGQQSAARSRSKTRSAGERGRQRVLKERASEGGGKHSGHEPTLAAGEERVHDGYISYGLGTVMVLKSYPGAGLGKTQ